MRRRTEALRPLVVSCVATGVLAIAAAPTAAAAVRSVDTPVRDVSATPGLAEGEETVAYNPTDPSNVIIGSNQWQPRNYTGAQDYVGLGPGGFTHCAVWSSHDGGRSWHGGPIGTEGIGTTDNPAAGAQDQFSSLTGGAPKEFDDPGNVFSADQNAVFDRHGNAYYTCIEFGARTGVEVLDVWRSSDGGRHWSDPVAAFSQAGDANRQMDRPFLAIDRRTGTLYLAWETIFYDPVHPEVFVRSSADGGRTWGPITQVDDAAHPAMWDARLFPMVGADGTLDIVYDAATFVTPFPWHQQFDRPSLVVASSTDGGQSFAYHWVKRDIPRPAPPDEAEPYLTEFISSMATDPKHPGHVAVAWPQRVHGGSRILMRASTDGGKTWTRLLDVTGDPRGNGNQHDHVMLRYLPDGSIVVVWRDRRYNGGGWYQPYDIFARLVRPGGDGSLHPGPTVRVTPHSERPSTAHRGHMPSEYLGIAVRGSRGIGVSWEEMRGDYPDDVYRFVPLSAFDG